ncbi:hypothetical protein [Corallococcus silvisoli]|uniref:hypothetical protein n=1 Tax=Corallococcus silvisoli TaxID=2697031 RepID=UPI001376AE74|nr:hypothetical protein [Corallococcus silvisoli]NBD12611.1 hypothetical protein [Corallococcus silvisoli]
MSSSLNEDSDVVRWLRAEREARGLTRIELSATWKPQESRYDDTVSATGPDGARTSSALPEAQRVQVQALLHQHPTRGNVELSILCDASSPPRIRLTDGPRRREDAKEPPQETPTLDARPYGRALAQRVVELLDAGADLSVTVDPREGVARALWKPADGTYAQGLRFSQGDSRPRRTFATREDFIRWLAGHSDLSLASEEHPDDPRQWGLPNFSRAYFARKTGRRS